MKKKVFISGITGTMGSAGLRHLLQYKDELELVSLVLDSPAERKKLAHVTDDDVKIIWGDLTNYDDVKQALQGVDIILHVAALISPAADHNPELAWAVNVGSMENILNNHLDFRRESFDDFLKRFKKQIGYPTRLLKYLLPSVIKKFVMKPIATGPNGSLNWIRSKQTEKTDAYWGSMENWEAIKAWETYVLDDDYSKVVALNHGYDETKKDEALGIEDMQSAAKYRGGKCLSSAMQAGNLDEPLEWECAFSHSFHASPRLVLKTGHWCEQCQAPPWHYNELAKKNPFLAQVHKP